MAPSVLLYRPAIRGLSQEELCPGVQCVRCGRVDGSADVGDAGVDVQVGRCRPRASSRPPSVLLNTPPPPSRVERAGRGGIDGERDDGVLLVRPVLAALQLLAAVRALEDAAADRPGVERAGRGGIDGERADVGAVGQACVGRVPGAPASVLLNTPPPTSPRRACWAWWDRWPGRGRRRFGQAGVGRAPGRARVRALEDAAVRPRVERAGRDGIDGEGGRRR